MKISFFGGVNEIGGNKILLEDKGTKIFLDFGKSYEEARKFFEEFVQPRAVHGIKDYLALDLIPKIEGIYRKDLIEILKRENFDFFDYREPLVDAVLLSHAHLDHAGYISFLDENIPIFCSNETKKILEVLQIIKPSNLENEIVEISFPRTEKDYKKREKLKRNFQTFNFYQPFKIKDLEILPIPVDHSILGATMFLIKGSKNVLYSGDFRLSELSEKEKERIFEILKREKIDIFLCEGTRILEKEILSEKIIYEQAKEKLQNVKGLIVADYSMTDTTRFQTLLALSKALKRKMALPFNYFGFLFLLKEKGINFKENFDNVVLYAKEKASFQKWEKELIQKYPFVKSEQIRENKKDYFVILNFHQIQELIDFAPDKDCYFLRASTEPHEEEAEISEERFLNWILHFQMQGLSENGKFERAHISGHISGKELGEFIEKIKPEIIIPIHTEHPEEFKNFPSEVLLVKKGETLSF